MHFDAHVAFEISENSQYIGDKFSVVPGLLVDDKVLHGQKKGFPHFQFHLAQWVFRPWISDELMELKTVKDANFQVFHDQSWRSVAQLSKAVTTLVPNFGDLFDQTWFHLQRWEEYPFSIHQRVVYDASCCARPGLIRVMLIFVPTIPHAHNTLLLGEPGSQQKKVHHL